MFGKPPCSIPDNYAIDVCNLAAAITWYREKLGLNESREKRDDDSGRPFADLQVSSGEPILSLVELVPGASASPGHTIFYARKLEKTREWLAGRGVAVEPITSDSGGNPLFRFHDLDGNSIEVCVEP